MKTPILLSAFICFLLHNANATTTSVTSTADAGAGTLRQAILSATSGDTILINTNDTIRITSGQMNIDKDLVITGPNGVPTKVISGEGVSKLFLMNNTGLSVTLSKLRIVNAVGSRGAAVYGVKGTLTIDSCHFENNIANSLATGGDGGGAIRLYNTMGITTISNSSFVANKSIHSYSATSSISFGGAIFSNATTAATKIDNCSFENNYAQCYAKVYGGAVALYGVPSGSYVENCTFYNNKLNSLLPRAAGGAGLYISGGYPIIKNNTIIANEIQSTSIAGAGISLSNSSCQITNNLIAGNIIPGGTTVPERADFYSSPLFTSNGYNLIETDPGAGSYSAFASDVIGQNPNILAFTNNGGLTNTIGFDCTSPAYAAGNPAFSGNLSQNGIVRPAAPDIGAYQKHDLPEVNVNVVAASCYGASTGSAEIGNPSKKTEHTWYPSQTTGNSISGLAAGNYYVTTTANNCTVVDSFTVSQADSILITGIMTDDTGGGNGAIDITATGGAGFYTYLWNPFATGEDLSARPQGTYAVTVTDNVGCTKSKSFVINLATVIEAANSNEVAIYPNPSYGDMTIQSSEDVLKIDIYTLEGRLIKTTRNLNLSLNSGSYFLKIYTSSNKTQIVKAIVK